MAAEGITKASPHAVINVSNGHPSPAVPEAIMKNRGSRFSERIEPFSFESEGTTDDRGTSSLPPTDSDSFESEVTTDDSGTSSLPPTDSDSFESEGTTDDSGTSSLPPTDSVSDGHGPTPTNWLLSFASLVLVISTVTISPLKHHLILGHHLWKFAAQPLAFFCGLLVSDCIVRLAHLAVPRRRYVLRRMEKAMGTYAWISLITLTWAFCFGKPMTSSDVRKVVDFFNRALRAILLTFLFWQIKIAIFETLRVTLYRMRFYRRLERVARDLYMRDALMDPRHKQKSDASMRKCIMEKTDEMMEAVLNTSRMPRLVADRQLLEYVQGFKGSEFKADDQSKILKAAREAFKRLANQDGRFIKKKDMEKFLTKEEVDVAFHLMENANDVGKISKLAFLEWMVETYQGRKSVVHNIIDVETIVGNLNALAHIPIIMIMFMITLILAGVAPPKVLVASFSQILLLGFMFQSTAKTIFECIVFVFVRHPFAVGDCCIIDGVKMIVEQINIMDTVFLRLDHEIIKYPNSELSKKPISNRSRSPQMSETIEFSIGISTPKNSVSKLREHIKKCLEGKPEHWQPKHSLFKTGIEDSKMKMDLNVLHRKGYWNLYEMNKRKSELLVELNTIFQNLGIENYTIPKETTPVSNGKDDTPVETTPSIPMHHG